jgi:uncharacterized protein (DUF302 family)
MIHQVPVDRDARTALRAVIGADTILALLLEDGRALVGEGAIEAYLDERFEEPAEGGGAPGESGEGAPPPPEGGMRMLATGRYTLSATTDAPFEDAVAQVRAELKDVGFGVLCEIDVQATLREKLGVERERYLILGACNPPLAHRALEAEPELGALLPCNVIVYEDSGGTRIAAIDPERMLSIVENEALAAVAAEVRALLAGMVERAAAGAPRHPGAENKEGFR